jgi:transposase
MAKVSTIGLDLAKHVFQVHGVDEEGSVVLRKKLRRGAVVEFFAKLAPCTVGIEACGGAHYWAREITALGHTVKLMPAVYVKPYVKRGKNDAADAEAICEAVMRPTMRFVPIKSAAQQANGMIYKVRELLVRQRTQLINALRAHLSELGIVAAQGIGKLADLIGVVRDESEVRVPAAARQALEVLAGQIETLDARIERLDDEIVSQVRASEAGRRLTSIPGVGPITAGALLAMVPLRLGSARHDTSRPGSALRRGKSPAAVNSEWGLSASRAIATCAVCSFLVQRTCCASGARTCRSPVGSPPCERAGHSRSSPWRLRTRWRASSGL